MWEIFFKICIKSIDIGIKLRYNKRVIKIGGEVVHYLQGGDKMVTYAELFQFCLVVIGVAGLILAYKRR